MSIILGLDFESEAPVARYAGDLVDAPIHEMELFLADLAAVVDWAPERGVFRAAA